MAKLPKKAKKKMVEIYDAGKGLYFMPIDKEGKLGKWVKKNDSR